MIMDVKKILKEDGVAFFEFIFFLPFMVLLMGLMISIGNSINGAINQQKIARSYFYARVSNNSSFPLRDPESNQADWRSFGMFFIGWREKSENDFPVQPCYKFVLPFGGDEDSCKDYKKDSTEYVRVGTVYGACGATYVRSTSLNGGSQVSVRAPAARGDVARNIVGSVDSCTITE